MAPRDRGETHRTATPLELFFDLCFVVAVAQAAGRLHHAEAEAHIASGLLGYVMVFFAIWWAWMNFTWFASAYDTDDVPYRLLTLLQMAGVLVLAAGVPAGLTEYDFTIVTLGYVLMRIAQVGQWLRAAREHPEGRAATFRYAIGISLVQLGWLLRLLLPKPFDEVGFLVLALCELAIPIWAEGHGRVTTWHPVHIRERYGLFTIIVLGEVVLASSTAVQSGLTEFGFSMRLLVVATGGMVVVFSLWWMYFAGAETPLRSQRIALVWGYGHALVFGSIAAVGAGLEVAVDEAAGAGNVSQRASALTVAVPLVAFVLVLAALHRFTGALGSEHLAVVGAGAVVLLTTAFVAPLFGIAATVAVLGLVLAGTVAGNIVLLARRGA